MKKLQFLAMAAFMALFATQAMAQDADLEAQMKNYDEVTLGVCSSILGSSKANEYVPGAKNCVNQCKQSWSAGASCLQPYLVSALKNAANKDNACHYGCNRYFCKYSTSFKNVCVSNCPKDKIKHCAEQQ